MYTERYKCVTYLHLNPKSSLFYCWETLKRQSEELYQTCRKNLRNNVGQCRIFSSCHQLTSVMLHLNISNRRYCSILEQQMNILTTQFEQLQTHSSTTYVAYHHTCRYNINKLLYMVCLLHIITKFMAKW